MPIGKGLWATLAVLGLCLVSCSALAGTDDRETLGHISVSVPCGGQFSPSQAEVLAQAKAWLDGIELTARSLASMDTVRLAGLDFMQVQALAALLGGVELPPPSFRDVDNALGQNLPNAEVSATLRIARPDAAAVSQALADAPARERLEEVIIALRRILPEALEWAERGRDLRNAASDSAKAPDDMVAARLSLLTSATAASLSYLDFLLGAPLTAELQATLDWAQDVVPPLAAGRADMLLRQDRPQAALHILRDLTAPPTAITPEKERWIHARSSAWTSVWTKAWPPHPSDLRLYARSLYLRGMAQLRSGQPALAEADFSAALAIDDARADFFLARGASYQVREIFDAMCSDYYQACALGLCEGLASAREQGRCLPQ